MEYGHSGNSQVRVSAWCLGTMMFGGQASPADVRDLISGKPGTPLDPSNGKLVI